MNWKRSRAVHNSVTLVCICAAVALRAESPNAAANSAAAAYVLGPDDQVVIRTLDVEELDGKPTRVDLRGYMDVPLVGSVKVTGLSVGQLETELTKRLSKYIKEPRVTVTVAEYQSGPVSVLGAVNTPGVYNMTGSNTLEEVLSKAGGLRNDAGNTIKITRSRAWGPIPLPGAKTDASAEFSIAEVNVKSLLDSTSPQENIVIKPADVISVPRADLVYVVGAVRKSGGFVLNERGSMSVLQALSLAEGLEKTSSPGHSKIIRGEPNGSKTEISVDLGKILSGKSHDLPLLANDILFIPTSMAKAAAYRSIEAAIQTGVGIAIFH